MIIIKRTAYFLSALILLFLCSCSNEKDFSEVNIENNMPVQILYRQKLYKGALCFKDNNLVISFFDNSSSVDGIILDISENEYKVSYNKMAEIFKTKSMPECNMGVILFKFFSSNANPLILTQKSDKGFYVKQTFDSATLKLYEQLENENKTYYIEIT